MNRRAAIAATVGAIGASLFGYVDRWFGWYWDNVVTPEPIRDSGMILIHQGNFTTYRKGVNPDYYATISLDIETGEWYAQTKSDGKPIPYNEWIKQGRAWPL